MMQIPATLYLANSSESHQVIMQLLGQQLLIQADTDAVASISLPCQQVKLSPALANLPFELSLPDGEKLVVAAEYKKQLEQGFGQHSGYGLLHWLEQNPWAWLLALLLVPVALYWLVQVVIPAAAKSVTPLVPYSVTKQIDKQVMLALDKTTLDASQLPAEQQQNIYQQWQSLLATLSESSDIDTSIGSEPLKHFNLQLRASELYGANAFALPGGTIVVTDDLVKLLAKQPDALIAVLLHEVGHVEHRHGLQMIAEATGTTLLMTYFFGDLEGAAELFSGTALTLIQNQFSQSLENEADDYAIVRLKHLNIPTTALGDALSAIAGEDNNSDLLEKYFSTHPTVKTRVEKALAASR